MSDSPWESGVNGSRSTDSINLVDGTTFVVSSRSGEIGDHLTHGLYMLDTRVVSRWRVELDGWVIEPLSYVPVGPFSGTFVSQAENSDQPDAPIALVQRRHVGRGMREDLEIRNHGPACSLTVRIRAAADLAGLFEVKAGRAFGGCGAAVAAPHGLRFVAPHDDAAAVGAVTVTSSPPPDSVDGAGGCMTWNVELGPGEAWTACLQVGVEADGAEIPPSHRCGEPVEEAVPVGRFRRWRETTPQLTTDHDGLDRAVAQAVDDLGALRIFDPDHAERVVVAAGAPWFMALFGRDSLLAAWMALPFDQELAEGVLAELADNQGTRVDARTEEEPGRILHEVRFDRLSAHLLGGSNIYYGTADATPLFVMLVAELARWTGVTDRIIGLMPAVDRAIDWIESYGDRDGDGFVEYVRSHPAGLEHQGWKDSWDGIRHLDGSVAVPPIALCEVQGYVYAAYRGRAALARALGEGEAVAQRYDARAADLFERFEQSYWLDDLGWYAVGLDQSKQPIRSLTSNIGHLLWSGIVPEHRAALLAGHLLSPAMFTGWGLRTLASTNAGYNPLSYHCGSVWPHDTAITVAGLSRYGLDEAAQLLGAGLIDAASTSGGRLPELFGGFARDDISAPVPYPTSCSPQAWSAASPLLLLRAMLGLEPDVPNGRLSVRPRVPASIGHVHLRGVRIGGRRVVVEALDRSAFVSDTHLELVAT